METNDSVPHQALPARTILFAHLVGKVCLGPSPAPYLPRRIRNLPLDEQAKYFPLHLSKIEESQLDHKEHLEVIRQIASYLGLPWKITRSPLLAAKTVREMVRKGQSDEEIALYLEKYLLQSLDPPGRPKAATEGPLVLRALELYESDRKRWTWPKVTDEVYDCKGHKHDNSHPCTEKLKQSVGRLRRFLKMLQSSSSRQHK